MKPNIPIVDISNLERSRAAKRKSVVENLCSAFHEVGFVAIQGHGISRTLFSGMREQAKELFNRPMQEKLKLRVQQDNYRGYIPTGFFTPNRAGERPAEQMVDQYEAYKLHYETDHDDAICKHCSLYGPNKWPLESKELKDTVQEYWRACDRVTMSLLGAIAEHLSVDEEYFRDVFYKPLSNMTLLHYPPAKAKDKSFGIHPHKDTDVLTILAPDPVGGLFVRSRYSKDWIAVNGPDDALIVNVGDMLEIWSGGYFVSTPHKVINPRQADRYSFPYFAVPRYDVLVEPLDFHEGEFKNRFATESSQPAQIEKRSMHCGDVSANIWLSNWPDAAAIDECYDPYIK